MMIVSNDLYHLQPRNRGKGAKLNAGVPSYHMRDITDHYDQEIARLNLERPGHNGPES